ncbi:zinc-ribbon domain-containing protein [Methanobacterium sp. MBAC-LM]
MVFCPECGIEYHNDVKFCDNCGEILKKRFN